MTASERPHARSNGPKCRGAGKPSGPTRAVAIVITSRFEARYPARKIASTTFASSAGWNASGPSLTHSFTPRPRVLPIGVSGSSSSAMPNSKNE